MQLLLEYSVLPRPKSHSDIGRQTFQRDGMLAGDKPIDLARQIVISQMTFAIHINC